MNAITFGTKRAFHGFLRFTRKPLSSMGLTAARFDMMCALLTSRHGGNLCHWTAQGALRGKLGVSAPVITRMLKALEALGLVVRERWSFGDRRRLYVRLTEEGERRIREARRAMVPAIRRLVFETICFGRHKDPAERLRHMDTLEGYLSALRKLFRDRAWLYFAWGHPDD